MIGQIIEIAEPERYLSMEYGSMLIADRNQSIARVAFDEILALVVNPSGVTLSAGLMGELARRGIPCVIAGKNFHPQAMVLPVVGHFETAARIAAQVDATLPSKKQAWRQLVQAKITMQAMALDQIGQESSSLWDLVPKVRSGDPVNVEAQAARKYWPRLFGASFRRERTQLGINALLNYGYAVMRAGVARAICAAGLHPSLGIHHKGPTDTMRLADDFIEPFRPLVDIRVHAMVSSDLVDVVPETKRMLVAILSTDVPTEVGRSPVSMAMHRLARSYVAYLNAERTELELPNREWRESLVDLAEAYL